MEMPQDTSERLLRFVSDELLNGEAIDPDENLLADGVVDSLGMMRLVAFIEDAFGVSIPPEHFTIENFRTIDSIARYLASSAGGASA
jgi:acyl carrier protein